MHVVDTFNFFDNFCLQLVSFHIIEFFVKFWLHNGLWFSNGGLYRKSYQIQNVSQDVLKCFNSMSSFHIEVFFGDLLASITSVIKVRTENCIT